MRAKERTRQLGKNVRGSNRKKRKGRKRQKDKAGIIKVKKNVM